MRCCGHQPPFRPLRSRSWLGSDGKRPRPGRPGGDEISENHRSCQENVEPTAEWGRPCSFCRTHARTQRHTQRHTHTHTHTPAPTHTDPPRHTQRHTRRQTDRQTDRQTGRQTDRQTHTHTHTHAHTYLDSLQPVLHYPQGEDIAQHAPVFWGRGGLVQGCKEGFRIKIEVINADPALP